MKRTFSANIDGQIFNIDEDAFQLLNNYLEQLRLTFPGDEGREIVADIESRIRELFNEQQTLTQRPISISDVTGIIATMGTPEALSGESGIEPEAQAQQPNFTPEPEQPRHIKRRLYRNPNNKILGGVLGGLAAYLGWNANIMRILLIILAIATRVWPLFIAYLIAWMIIPQARTPRQILEMQGEPVNIDNVGRVVTDRDPAATPKHKSSLTTFFEVIGKIILAVIGLIAAAGVIFGTLTEAGLFIAYITEQSSSNIFNTMSFGPFDTGNAAIGMFPALMCGFGALIAICLPICSGVWTALTERRGFPASVNITLIIIGILLIISSVISASWFMIRF